MITSAIPVHVRRQVSMVTLQRHFISLAVEDSIDAARLASSKTLESGLAGKRSPIEGNLYMWADKVGFLLEGHLQPLPDS